MGYLKPEPVYKASITIQKVILNILICYIVMGFVVVIMTLLDVEKLPVWIVPFITGATVFLTNIFKQLNRVD